MKIEDKVKIFKELRDSKNISVEEVYELLDKCNVIKGNYRDYMTTQPMDCDTELRRTANADYDLCCALVTMLLREDHFCNGSFERRVLSGQFHLIVERMLEIFKQNPNNQKHSFSEKALESLNGFYVYALIDPRDNKIFYIGKGTGNRVFMHEVESEKSIDAEKKKLKKIRDIENDGFQVKRLLVNWGLTENEAFAAEASLINLLNYIPDFKLTNEVAGHHVHVCLTTEAFEHEYGAIALEKEDIKHGILVIKINKLYRRGMSEEELYDVVRGYWAASLRSIQLRNVKYVFGVYNGLIVAVYKPDEWHYCHEMIDAPQMNLLKPEDYERLKNRVYFICKDYNDLDEEGKFYLYKSIENLKVNQSAQNPITYLMPEGK